MFVKTIVCKTTNCITIYPSPTPYWKYAVFATPCMPSLWFYLLLLHSAWLFPEIPFSAQLQHKRLKKIETSLHKLHTPPERVLLLYQLNYFIEISQLLNSILSKYTEASQHDVYIFSLGSDGNTSYVDNSPNHISRSSNDTTDTINLNKILQLPVEYHDSP